MAQWNYNDVKLLLDQLGDKRKTPKALAMDLSKQLHRTVAGVKAEHYLWNIYLGRIASHRKAISTHMKALFDAYFAASGTRYTKGVVPVEQKFANGVTVKIVRTSDEVEKAVSEVEKQFQVLRESITNLVVVAVDVKVKKQLAEKQSQFENMERELADLRKLRDQVKNSQKFMEMREHLAS